MARDIRDLIASLAQATESGYRGRLIARGQAQSMIRRAGVLPQDAPQFSPFLDADLVNYSYALLSTSLELLDVPGSSDDDLERGELARDGFIQASYALEAATRNAAPGEDLAFHGLVAGAASHLGGYAARAFSLMQASLRSGRLTPMEQTLGDLIMRNLSAIEQRTRSLRSSPQVSDEALLTAFTVEDDGISPPSASDQFGPVFLLLDENYLSAVSTALFAIEIGNRELFNDAFKQLRLGEQAAFDVGAPGPWWVYRLTRRLLEDLFESSMETNIPEEPPAGSNNNAKRWRYLRRTFVESLLARGRSEIDLWPSQLHVVDRIFKSTRDLVVALPTSAGKTRIAELSILACIAQSRRVVYVTPLRALSAQTEQILTRTFSPLGLRVSTLYGSMGVSNIDGDMLRSCEIVVATPEKLDFALRSDPSVLDDVGLVVLDEGHMIGSSEREVRYEAQIQRLLRRRDASMRRILCLSAVFPSGDQLDDFVAWITDDEPDGLHLESWRPTQQRFGMVEWRDDHARLTINLGAEEPFIPRYFEAKKPTGRRRKTFPADQRELVIATGWRLVEEGQTVLIFCPQRNSVEPYAREIVKLYDQGLLSSVLAPDVNLSNALTVGTQWFDADHPILRCLQLGVAVHHGSLPSPFRREVERLLQQGSLKITIASPTLAQGLNLSASAVLFHGVRRAGKLLKGSEFANVIGRAGRAFVDTEGLVLYPIFRPTETIRQEWLELTSGDGGKALQSGLIQIGIALLTRMHAGRAFDSIEPFLEYLTGGPDWSLPIISHEQDDGRAAAEASWHSNLALLDIGILSIVGDGDQDADAEAVTQMFADALRDSLWERQLRRFDDYQAALVRELVYSRARHLWQVSTPSQRRGWFLAGLGAEAGSELSQVSERIVNLTFEAEAAIDDSEHETAGNLLVAIAEIVFAVESFAPKKAIDNWSGALRHWVWGLSLSDFPGDRMAVAQFIESDLIYRLAWGMEAARVFESAQDNADAEALKGIALTAIETGTFNRAASTLIRLGFDYRLAAISAVTSSDAVFHSTTGMNYWIKNLDPEFSLNPNWPTPESRAAWVKFVHRTRTMPSHQWERQVVDVEDVTWNDAVPDPGTWLRVTNSGPKKIDIWSTGYDLLGEAAIGLNPERQGILRASRLGADTAIRLWYRGPGDLLSQAL